MPIAPITEEAGELPKKEVVEQVVVESETAQWEELVDRYDELMEKFSEQFGGAGEQKVKGPLMVTPPPKPTKEELEKHQLTHTPYQSWCIHCAAARAVRRKHPSKGRKHDIIVDHDKNIMGPAKISMDYRYLHERAGPEKEAAYNPPHLVVTEHKHGRVWAYRVPNKGVMGEAEWLPTKITQDLNNNGMQDITWHIKTDQEPAIVTLQSAMQTLCPNQIAPTNSPVGESACNGRAENAIRRVQEKVRVLRHQIESKIKEK